MSNEFTNSDAYEAVMEAKIELEAQAHDMTYGKLRDIPRANRLKAQGEQLQYTAKFLRNQQNEIAELRRKLSYARA